MLDFHPSYVDKIAQRLREADSEMLSNIPMADYSVAPDWFHEGQLEFWNVDRAEQYHQILVCGAQFGKTRMAPHLALRGIQECSELIAELGGGNWLYIGPTIDLLRKQAIPMFVKVFQDEEKLGKMVYSPKPVFHFNYNGLMKMFGRADLKFQVHFVFASDPNNLESITAVGANWDEAGQTPNKKEAHEALMRRLSIAQGRGFGKVFYTTTPYAWNWFKEEIVDRADKGTDGYIMVNGPTWMNPMQDKDHIISLRETMPAWRWSMMYEGMYTRPAGLIYDCWKREHIIPVPQMGIPRDAKIYVGVDFGGVNTAALFAAVMPDGEIHFYNEYAPDGNTDTWQHANEMKVRAGRPVTSSRGGAPSEDRWRQSFAQAGFPVLKPTVNGLEDGISIAYAHIASGRVKVWKDRCPTLVRDIERYARDVDDVGNVLESISEKSKYHVLDAMRYLLSSIPLEVRYRQT